MREVTKLDIDYMNVESDGRMSLVGTKTYADGSKKSFENPVQVVVAKRVEIGKMPMTDIIDKTATFVDHLRGPAVVCVDSPTLSCGCRAFDCVPVRCAMDWKTGATWEPVNEVTCVDTSSGIARCYTKTPDGRTVAVWVNGEMEVDAHLVDGVQLFCVHGEVRL
jgi:hypothetical protein